MPQIYETQKHFATDLDLSSVHVDVTAPGVYFGDTLEDMTHCAPYDEEYSDTGITGVGNFHELVLSTCLCPGPFLQDYGPGRDECFRKYEDWGQI
jgi:hypothetical protein